MGDTVFKGRFVPQRRGQHVQGVKPAAGLADILHDKVGRMDKLVFVAVGVMVLGERHGAGLEPAVKDLCYALGNFAGIGLNLYFVDEGFVQIGYQAGVDGFLLLALLNYR